MTMLAHLAALASTLAMLGPAGAFVASTRPRGVTSSKLAATTTTEEPVLTLYRDTNGWCPFCERVWIGLEKKGIPYDEKLINLQDKPQWYLDIVPTTLVPAIEWHDENWKADTPGSGALVWESKDILEMLDARFAETPLRSADDEVAEVVEVLNASVGFVYGARNGTADDKGARFAAARRIQQQTRGDRHGGARPHALPRHERLVPVLRKGLDRPREEGHPVRREAHQPAGQAPVVFGYSADDARAGHRVARRKLEGRHAGQRRARLGIEGHPRSH